MYENPLLGWICQLSDVLKPLHLKVVFGRKYRFQNFDFSQVAEAPRKVRRRGFSIMYPRKLRGRATVQSRKHEIVVFLHARKRKLTSISFLNPRKRRGCDSLFKPLAEGTFHAAQAPRKPLRRGFEIFFWPQLGLEHCSIETTSPSTSWGAYNPYLSELLDPVNLWLPFKTGAGRALLSFRSGECETQAWTLSCLAAGYFGQEP